MENSRGAPLHKIAAHEANDGGVLPKMTANDIDLLLVPQMKGVVFANNADSFQKFPSF